MLKFTVFSGFFAVLLQLTACGGKSDEVTAPSLPEVVTEVAALSPYNGQYRFVGRLESREKVDISAQVSGFIVSRSFTEGQWVNAGDVLFEIDNEPFTADLAKAEAQLEAAQANFTTNKRNFLRSQKLVKSGTISQADFDRSEGQYLDAKANVTLAEAQIKSAQLNLDYATVTSPIAGYVGAKSVDVGDLVGPQSAALTTVKSLDPIQVSFKVDENTYLMAKRPRMEQVKAGAAPEKVKVFVELSDGEAYPDAGEITFIDNHIDLQTATIAMRADIPNADGFLVPGQYVKAIVKTPTVRDVVRISQAALMKDQQGDYLFSVDANSTVQRRNVTVGDREGTNVFILSGIEPGERIIIKGLQSVRPGLQVSILDPTQAADAAASDTP